MLSIFIIGLEVFSVFTGAHAVERGKDSYKVRYIGISAIASNTFHSHFCFGQQDFCFFATDVIDVGRNGMAGQPMKGARQVAFTHSGDVGQFIQRKCSVTFRMYVPDSIFDRRKQTGLLVAFFALNAVSLTEKRHNAQKKGAQREDAKRCIHFAIFLCELADKIKNFIVLYNRRKLYGARVKIIGHTEFSVDN